ncbi:MAG: hypothetical protein AB1512_12625 [Thermodesulfobacteriota bacterium]
MIRSHVDYSRKGNVYFQTPSLRREAFEFLEARLQEKLTNKNPGGVSDLLSDVTRFLRKEPDLWIRHVDDGLVSAAEDFLVRNVDTIMRLCAMSRDPWDRYHSLYLMARFLPEVEAKHGGIRSIHLVQGYLLFIHTLSHPELFLRDAEGRETRACFVVAVKGLYRWDGLDILKTWNTAPDLIASIKEGMSDEGKKRQEPILRHAARIAAQIRHQKDGTPEDMLALLFTSALLVAARYRLLRDERRDLLHEIWTGKSAEVMSSLRGYHGRLFGEDLSDIGAVEAFIAGRLGEVWQAEEIARKAMEGAPMGIRIMESISQMSGYSGRGTFSKEELDMIRRLSSIGPKVS